MITTTTMLADRPAMATQADDGRVMRTILHFSPAAGWLNDPNGLIEHCGVHHLFFQHNPHELAMRDMCWGHASSPDLLTWTEHPVALRPGPDGSYDEDGCWSGCAVHDAAGVAVVYSGNKDGIQLPCLARALDDDLITWEKSPDNPVIPHRPPVEGITAMRDHSIRWDGERWRQVIAGGAAGEGMLFGYSSPDLSQWSWDGIVLRAGESGLPGEIWECPDVFEFDDQLVAIISVLGGDRPLVVWVSGSADRGKMRARRWGLLDYGDRFYAPQSYSDHSGRRIMFGWLRTQADPATRGEASAGVMSLPRILSLAGGRLHQAPAPELRRRRGPGARHSLPPGQAGLSVPVSATPAFEAELTCASWQGLRGMTADLLDDEGHRIHLDFSLFFEPGRFTGPEGSHGPDGLWEATATIIFDSGIVEVFTDGKAAAFSDARLRHITELRLRVAANVPVGVAVWSLTGSSLDRAPVTP
jgi:beta-fructofuranosidase